MTTPAKTARPDDDGDAAADVEIQRCLTSAAPRSFFLFAGAGSGKTRSLVKALEHVQETQRQQLQSRGQRVAVVTFTNAARDEIRRRLHYDPIIDVRTIHSFAWSLIDGLNRDIREWLRARLTEDIVELRSEEAAGKKGTAASDTRLRRIASKSRRLQNLDNVKQFSYSPTGDNRTRDALNHAEVLQITASFLQRKPTMQNILVGRHPIVLIDESQDTNRHLIDALFAVQAAQKSRFVLGLIGDTMQRIYADGKDGLGAGLPEDWAKPSKQLNHRCPKRVVALINNIRSAGGDKHHQSPRSDADDGLVRVFVLPSDTADKPGSERAVAQHMARVTDDEAWIEPKSIKTLTLEHRMAAARMHFLEMFAPLYAVESWRTSFLEGELPASRFFTEQVLPLVTAKQSGDRFAVARVAKALSPLLSPEALRAQSGQRNQLKLASAAIDDLMLLWNGGVDPSLRQVLRCISTTGLLEVPEILEPHTRNDEAPATLTEEEDADRERERFAAIEKLLNAPFSQVERFATYMAGNAHFDTHQGVKGLEFDRVMVVMDDSDAKGFTFKYENLFGGKGAGDRTVEATRRLFYVTCSRAKRSLALVAYAREPNRVRRFLVDEGWFDDDEILSDLANSTAPSRA
jgi:DNA helicase-2/ATP-dependent DNA helicase PcrA